jgi:ribosome-associated translation inhibitor RaiA
MKPRITDQQIVSAGMKLQSQNKAINGWSLRKLIGAGSPDRLNQVWEAHVEGRLKKAESKSVPRILPIEALVHMEKAREEFEKNIAKIASHINDATFMAAESRFQDFELIIKKLELELESEKARSENYRQKLEKLEQIHRENDALDSENGVDLAEAAAFITQTDAEHLPTDLHSVDSEIDFKEAARAAAAAAKLGSL